MKLAIMQPYFLPYIGYFQLINAVDLFVVYDNIKYTKKGWINRNRYLCSSGEAFFSVPLKKDSDEKTVVERRIAESFDRKKMFLRFREAYRKAPCFSSTIQLVESVINYSNDNLFAFIRYSIGCVCTHLAIPTRLVTSSEVPIDHSLKAEDKVLALCRELKADRYINAIGGVELYSKERFAREGIELQFIKSDPVEYRQFGNPFVPWLSIVDCLMFNSVPEVREMLHKVTFV
jgi:hypothetical protein